MKNLLEVAERLRVNTAALVAVTELHEELTVDSQSNANAPGYINGYTLGGVERAIHVLAESTAKDSDYLADKIAEMEGQK